MGLGYQGLQKIHLKTQMPKKRRKIVNTGKGSLSLKAGLNPGGRDGKGIVIFEENAPQIKIMGSGRVKIYYNSQKGSEYHKYHNSQPYLYKQHIETNSTENNTRSYMLINNVRDLQDIAKFLHGDYALSQDIAASETKDWNSGSGFKPLKDSERNIPFSDNFDGNGYAISNLFVNSL